MSLPSAPVVHINILYANTVLSSGRGGDIIQRNSIHPRIQVTETRSNAPHSMYHSFSATNRRVEAQPRIRDTLEEVSTQPEHASSRIGRAALLATGILAVVEQENISFSAGSVDLAMDAHAVAYIVVVSFLHRRLRMSRKRVDKLNKLLAEICTLLLEVAATGNMVFLLKKFVNRNQRKMKIMRAHEELLHMLRRFERNDDVDLLSSLNAALEWHHQNTHVNTAE